MVEYTPEPQYKLVKVMFGKDHFLYVSSYPGELTKLDGYMDYHKWVDYEHYKDDCNKKYLGKISSDMQFKKRGCTWRV